MEAMFLSHSATALPASDFLDTPGANAHHHTAWTVVCEQCCSELARHPPPLASVFCHQDGAFLCPRCDEAVHLVNKIASRHVRVPYHSCPAWAYREAKDRGHVFSAAEKASIASDLPTTVTNNQPLNIFDGLPAWDDDSAEATQSMRPARQSFGVELMPYADLPLPHEPEFIMPPVGSADSVAGPFGLQQHPSHVPGNALAQAARQQQQQQQVHMHHLQQRQHSFPSHHSSGLLSSYLEQVQAPQHTSDHMQHNVTTAQNYTDVHVSNGSEMCMSRQGSMVVPTRSSASQLTALDARPASLGNHSMLASASNQCFTAQAHTAPIDVPGDLGMPSTSRSIHVPLNEFTMSDPSAHYGLLAGSADSADDWSLCASALHEYPQASLASATVAASLSPSQRPSFLSLSSSHGASREDMLLPPHLASLREALLRSTLHQQPQQSHHLHSMAQQLRPQSSLPVSMQHHAPSAPRPTAPHHSSGSSSTAQLVARIERPDGTIKEINPERAAQLHRYRHKRMQRLKAYAEGQKKIRYECRKALADTRPRVKGRFVKAASTGDLEGAAAESLAAAVAGSPAVAASPKPHRGSKHGGSMDTMERIEEEPAAAAVAPAAAAAAGGPAPEVGLLRRSLGFADAVMADACEQPAAATAASGPGGSTAAGGGTQQQQQQQQQAAAMPALAEAMLHARLGSAPITDKELAGLVLGTAPTTSNNIYQSRPSPELGCSEDTSHSESMSAHTSAALPAQGGLMAQQQGGVHSYPGPPAATAPMAIMGGAGVRQQHLLPAAAGHGLFAAAAGGAMSLPLLTPLGQQQQDHQRQQLLHHHHLYHQEQLRQLQMLPAHLSLPAVLPGGGLAGNLSVGSLGAQSMFPDDVDSMVEALLQEHPSALL